MIAADYLAGLHAYWINLDRRDDMRDQWHQSGAGKIFTSATRVHAVDGEMISDEAVKAYRDEWEQVVLDNQDVLTKINYTPGTWKFTSGRPSMLRLLKATLGCYRSHLIALKMARYDDHPRFVVSEDDAVPRSMLFSEEIDAPPEDAELLIWGGGIPMFHLSGDDRHFESGKPAKWHKLTGRACFTAFGTTAYEVRSQWAANVMIEQLEAHPMALDHAWGFALQKLEVYRLAPTGFAQVGRSDRNGKLRTPILERPWR